GCVGGGAGEVFERLAAGRPLAEPVDERPPMGLDQAVGALGRRGGHAVTCAGTSPSSSSFAIKNSAGSSGVFPSVSTTTSGFSGGSYGSSTPVKPLISPANAFL